MKVLLISANTERIAALPLPLGLACVAAACRDAGHDAHLLNLMFEVDAERAIRESIESLRPDVIGISVRNIDDQSMAPSRFLLPPVRDVAMTCRNHCAAPIVLGGPGFSIFPQGVLAYLGADMGICGEGEGVFPMLLDRLERGAGVDGLPGICIPGRPPVPMSFAAPLDPLPLPEPGLWIPAVSGDPALRIPFQTKRGCPMLCSYCSTKDIQGTLIRRRSVEGVVDWLETITSRNFRKFVCVDNAFNIPPSYAKQLCRAIIGRGLKLDLWCIVYPRWADSELAQLMARAGCTEISLGFESGSESVLRGMNKRFTAEQVRTVSKMFADAGIRREGFLLLGEPAETRDTVEESLAFADSLSLDSLKVSAGIRIYPNTALASVALAQGVIKPGDDLLQPTFYLAPGLEPWLRERIASYRAERPWVM